MCRMYVECNYPECRVFRKINKSVSEFTICEDFVR